MNYYELKITVLLKEDVRFTKSSEMIGKNISYIMLKDENLKEYHKEKVYKYVFDNFFPAERDGIYKANRIYVFNIRSFNHDFIIKIKEYMQNYESNDFKIMSLEVNNVNQKNVTFLETITPAIVTIDSKPWLPTMDILVLIRRLHANAEKKYKFFFKEEIGQVEDYFIEKLRIINTKPVAYEFKGKKLLGNKFRIKVNDDEKSQKLAFTMLGAGLAEKNSILGAGYCIKK